MKNYIYAFAAIISLCLSGCQDEFLLDDLPVSKGEGISFHIKSPESLGSEATRGNTLTRVSSLRYLLADCEGKVLTHCIGHLSEALDRLDIDGLPPGDYSIAFLGSSYESSLARIEMPEYLDESWLHNTMESMPVGGSYYIKKIDFTLSPELKSRDYEVVLDRAVSMISVEFPGIPAAVEAMISSVTISLDEGSHVYSTIKGDGTYAGAATIDNHEVCGAFFDLTLSTLPAVGTLSGTVKVRSATLSGDSISTSYRFSGLRAEAGKMNKIAINLHHPDIKTGFINIRPQDYIDYDADLMLMEDEPFSVLHDSLQRSFRLTDPLMMKTCGGQLRLQLFSAVPACGVDIYANFPSLGIDSVHMVHLDRVEALLDMLVPMTFTKREAQYLDIHGKRVTLPKMDIPSDIQWIVRTDDPFLTRMSQLGLRKWNVSFHNWESVWPSKAIAPDIKSMRHAMVQMINLALTFDSEEFMEEFEALTGQYEDSGINLTNESILASIREGVANYGLGASNPSSGSNGWGGGRHEGFISLIVNQAYYAGMYPSVDPDTPCNRERECFYHEHAHCLGFTHDGNMTYGGLWTNMVGRALLKASEAGKIFFNTPDFIEGLPYRRSDAPEWARPFYR